MNIAYIVSAYKLPDQFARLVRRLDSEGVRFVVHVDAKTPAPTYRLMRQGAEHVANLTFLERHACHWGGFGHVEASLKGIASLLDDGDPFDYAVLLTGQDYPLCSPAAIERFLEGAAGASFIRNFPLPQPDWDGRGGLDRLESWHLTRYRRLHLSLPLRRRIPGGLAPYGGSPYWSLSRGAIEWIHEFVHRQPDYVRFFKHVYIPDELFFQTILMNSPYRDELIDANLRFIDWSTVPAPAILTVEHFDRLMHSGMLFARKFDETVDREILDLLDERIDGDLGEVERR